MKVLISKHCAARIPRQMIESSIYKILKQFKKNKVAVPKHYQYLSIAFIDAKQMRKTNASFRDKNKVTDILSFSSLDPTCYGELVICFEQIVKQAAEHKLSTQDELLYMLIHGCLHLLGYDHEKSAEEANEMFAIQDRIFYALCK